MGPGAARHRPRPPPLVRRAVEAGDGIVTGHAAERAFTELGFDDRDIAATLRVPLVKWSS